MLKTGGVSMELRLQHLPKTHSTVLCCGSSPSELITKFSHRESEYALTWLREKRRHDVFVRDLSVALVKAK